MGDVNQSALQIVSVQVERGSPLSEAISAAESSALSCERAVAGRGEILHYGARKYTEIAEYAPTRHPTHRHGEASQERVRALSSKTGSAPPLLSFPPATSFWSGRCV